MIYYVQTANNTVKLSTALDNNTNQKNVEQIMEQ